MGREKHGGQWATMKKRCVPERAGTKIDSTPLWGFYISRRIMSSWEQQKSCSWMDSSQLPCSFEGECSARKLSFNFCDRGCLKKRERERGAQSARRWFFLSLFIVPWTTNNQWRKIWTSEALLRLTAISRKVHGASDNQHANLIFPYFLCLYNSYSFHIHVILLFAVLFSPP